MKTKSLLLLHLIVFIWGFPAILGELITLNTFQLVFYRMGLAVITLGIYILFSGVYKFRVRAKSLKYFVISGFILAIHWVAFFASIKISTVSVGLITLSTAALFSSLLAPFWNKTKIVRYELILGVVVILGLVIAFGADTQYLWGILLGIFAAFLSATFSLINERLVKVHPPARVAFYEILSGTIFIGIINTILGKWTIQMADISTEDWIYLVILSGLCTAFAFVNAVKVMKHLSAYTVVLTLNLEPIYGVVFAYIVFGKEELMSVNFYIGMLVILSSIVIEFILKKRKRKIKMIE